MTTQITWDRLRAMIRARDNETCVYCGAHAPDGSADHILPVSKGGGDTFDNLVWTCRSCNSSKHDKTLREWIKGIKPSEQEREENHVTRYRDYVFCSTLKECRREHKARPNVKTILIRPDPYCAGWDCECGGYGYIDWAFGFPAVSYPDGVLHGHHHPQCILLAYLKVAKGFRTPWYNPETSYMRDGLICYGFHGQPELFACSLPLREGDSWYDFATFHVRDHIPNRSYIPTFGQFMAEYNEIWERVKTRRTVRLENEARTLRAPRWRPWGYDEPQRNSQ